MSGQQENYGKSDPACVAKVKELYKELNLEVCPDLHVLISVTVKSACKIHG